MPELPEVEVVRRGLEPRVLGRRIEGVEVFDARSIRRHEGNSREFETALTGARVDAVARRGKFLWLELSETSRPFPRSAFEHERAALVIHLGMSGQLRVREGRSGSSPVPPGVSEGPAPDPHRHLRIRVRFDGGAIVDFVDQRIFGGMQVSPLTPTPDGKPAAWGTGRPLIPVAAAHIARDALDPHFDLRAVSATLRKRRAPIKNLILSQSIVSGIGNIYADEALWAARVHYASTGAHVSAMKVNRLLNSAQEVMHRALDAGGTSFDALYVNVDGRSGYFARSLCAYGKEGEACPRCGRPIIRESFMNRSSYLCTVCQRKR